MLIVKDLIISCRRARSPSKSYEKESLSEPEGARIFESEMHFSTDVRKKLLIIR